MQDAISLTAVADVDDTVLDWTSFTPSYSNSGASIDRNTEVAKTKTCHCACLTNDTVWRMSSINYLSLLHR